MAPAAPRGEGSSASPSYTFVSAPDLHPPELQVLTRKAGIAAGDFLTANNVATRVGQPAQSQCGPLILDSQARPVWYLSTGCQSFDLQQQTYRGKPVLIWLQGQTLVIVDEQYHRVATLRSHAPWSIDIHDAYITGGDVWVSVTRIVKDQNLTSYGGPRNGTVLDVGLQEFQISTGHLLRTWDALNPGGKASVPLSESEAPASGRYGSGGPKGASFWDAYHLNSVQPLPNGDLLVSLRNTWAVYLIDPVNDTTIWTLGGKDSSFRLGSGAAFAWQHDARLTDPSQKGEGANIELTLFNDDNGGPGSDNKPSAGVILSLNTTTREAKLVRAYRHYPPLSSQVEGSMDLLPNGNALVGWGSEPYFSEYSPSGKDLLDVRWPGSNNSYRALFTNAWVGKPYYPPRGAVRGSTVYASWNGATQVVKWEVLADSRTAGLKVVATQARIGFETAIKLGQSYGDYEVRAIGAGGETLGTSKVFS